MSFKKLLALLKERSHPNRDPDISLLPAKLAEALSQQQQYICTPPVC